MNLKKHKYQRIKKGSKTGKYLDTFDTCLKLIPEDVQKALPWHQLAKLVDVIQASYEKGFEAGWEEAK